MTRNSKHVKAAIQAYKKGYRVRDGKLYNPEGKELNPYLNPKGTGYYQFSIRWNTGGRGFPSRHTVFVHHLIAYQKYGKKAFAAGMQIRHLDNNSINNSYSNISIGSASDNSMDRPPEDRYAHAVRAATDRRLFTDAEVDEIRRLHADGWTYSKLMEEFGISSKGTMSHIIHHDYKTIKE